MKCHMRLYGGTVLRRRDGLNSGASQGSAMCFVGCAILYHEGMPPSIPSDGGTKLGLFWVSPLSATASLCFSCHYTLWGQ